MSGTEHTDDTHDAGTTVTDNPDAGRFEITWDGKPAGFSQYFDRDGDSGAERIFFHTSVPDEFSGHGLASILTREALTTTAAAGGAIVPVCPYVAAWLERHPDFSGTVTKPTNAHLAAVRQA